MDKFSVGDKVRRNLPNGSVGTVVAVRKDGPFADEPWYYVRYQYGLDVHGKPMTCSSGLLKPQHLRSISGEEWAQTAETYGFGNGEKDSDN